MFFEKKCIQRLNDLTVEMIQAYFNDYGLCRMNDGIISRTEQTVKLHFLYVNSFIEALAINKLISIKVKNLSIIKESYNVKTGEIINKKVPAFDIIFDDYNNKKQIRDIPNNVFPILLTIIINEYPRILGAVALQCFAGLRPSEALNVRREDSKLGPGIIFTKINNKIINVEIDLNHQYILRSDGVYTGGIKRKRTVKVNAKFLEPFINCYNVYMQYLRGKKYEEQYGPFSINRDGLALPYKGYYNTMNKVVNKLCKKLLKSNDPELIAYAQLIQENGLNPHAFRHWFSANLTLMGASAEELKYYRGDKNINSSQIYIENKGDLEKVYRRTAQEVFDFSMWKAAKLYDCNK